MTERNVGQTVPEVGIVLGAALNAKTLTEVAAADYVYRETILKSLLQIGHGDADRRLVHLPLRTVIAGSKNQTDRQRSSSNSSSTSATKRDRHLDRITHIAGYTCG